MELRIKDETKLPARRRGCHQGKWRDRKSRGECSRDCGDGSVGGLGGTVQGEAQPACEGLKGIPQNSR